MENFINNIIIKFMFFLMLVISSYNLIYHSDNIIIFALLLSLFLIPLHFLFNPTKNNFVSLIIFLFPIKVLISLLVSNYPIEDQLKYMEFINGLNDGSLVLNFDGNVLGYIIPSVGYTYFFIGNLIGNFDAEYLIVFNNLFISLGCIIWMKLFHYKPFYCMIITIFYFSEESFFYSSWVGKESFLFFLTPLTIYLTYRKSVFIIPIIIIGSLYRPYFLTSIISVLLFFNFFKKDKIKYLFIISTFVSFSYLIYRDLFF
jgi:hypothetical protein